MTTWQNYAVNTGTAVTSWRYNPQTGRLAAKIYPAPSASATTSTVSYSYTPAGRLYTRTWARGLVTTYGYHSDGALASVDYGDDDSLNPTPDVAYSYYRHGQIKEVRDGLLVGGVITDANLRFRHAYTFDAELRPDAEAIQTFGQHQITRHYEGTADGQAPGRYAGFTYSGASPSAFSLSVNYAFDVSGRLREVTSPAGAFTYAYVTDSDLVESVTGPVHTVTHTHQPKGNGLLTKTNTVGQTTISRFGYTINDLNQRVVSTSTGTAFAQPAQSVYRYNEKGEVIAGDRFEGDNPNQRGAPILPESYAYAFDDIGNRKKATRGAAVAPLEQQNYTANLLNQYAEISSADLQSAPVVITPTHDLDGNLKSDDRWTYTWDGENRLIRMEAIAGQNSTVAHRRLEFIYDHQSRRVRKRVFTAHSGTTAWAPVTDLAFIYDGWNLIAELTSSSTSPLNWSVHRSFVWGTDLSGSLQGSGGVGGLLTVSEVLNSQILSSFFPSYDGNGNVSEYLNASGAIVAHYEYSLFSEIVKATGTEADAFSFRFSTKYEDGESGYYYYGFRYYNSFAGRWLVKDPVGEGGGFNLYGFVYNNTNGYHDFLGGSPRRHPNRVRGSGGDVAGLVLGLRVIGGLPFDVLSGDFRPVRPLASIGESDCNVLITVNGIWNNEDRRDRLNSLVSQAPRYKNAIPMMSENHTTLYVGDILQIIGDELGLIQVSSRRLARHINSVYVQMVKNKCSCPKIQILAHSQGTMVFERARPLLDKNAAAAIHYTGIGGQTTIQGGHGLARVENYTSKTDFLNRDWVPVIGNYNPLRVFSWIQDGFPDYTEFTQPHSNILEHSYEPYYAGHVDGLGPD